jgi:hypothetical protein
MSLLKNVEFEICFPENETKIRQDQNMSDTIQGQGKMDTGFSACQI